MQNEVKRQDAAREYIEGELGQYRAIRCRIEEIRIDMEALNEELEHRREDVIAGEVLGRPQEPDAGRGGSISDPTARVALGGQEAAQYMRLRVEMRALARRLRLMDAWLASLKEHERVVLKMLYVRGMWWGEVVHIYNQAPLDGKHREERTLREWKSNALDAIAERVKMKSAGIPPEIRHALPGSLWYSVCVDSQRGRAMCAASFVTTKPLPRGAFRRQPSSFIASASCRVWEKLIPACSARAFRKEGMLSVFFTNRLSSLARTAGM